ncbi:cupin domain-containing protein [Henriciella marina]|uniref:cupin domain-containing protein n=1 Tax=Henriciella marina TaxID=453851 RepID=UPI0003815D17|nr:cupin domain-containing protein [Henriciella marina]
MKTLIIAGVIAAIAGPAYAHGGPDHSGAETLPAGSNEKLRAPIASADGLEVLISDVVIPPGATVPRHYHPGEEFLYVISGSAVHVQDGQEDIILSAGDSYVIPPRAAHAPRGGPDGARAVVFRVHRDGMPERILLEDGETPPPEDDAD